jgi:hypothetical protein
MVENRSTRYKERRVGYLIVGGKILFEEYTKQVADWRLTSEGQAERICTEAMAMLM